VGTRNLFPTHQFCVPREVVAARTKKAVENKRKKIYLKIPRSDKEDAGMDEEKGTGYFLRSIQG
jgi:hypothetical protein